MNVDLSLILSAIALIFNATVFIILILKLRGDGNDEDNEGKK